MKKSLSTLALAIMLLGTTNSSRALADNKVRNGLPPTSMDSFVAEAYKNNKESAFMIYGDEGVDGIPPYQGFTEQHRINRGIAGINNQGLTTGHASYLPDAWGGDEFTGKPEWSQSGPNNGQSTAYQEPIAPPHAGQGPAKYTETKTGIVFDMSGF